MKKKKRERREERTDHRDRGVSLFQVDFIPQPNHPRPNIVFVPEINVCWVRDTPIADLNNPALTQCYSEIIQGVPPPTGDYWVIEKPDSIPAHKHGIRGGGQKNPVFIGAKR